MPASSPLLSLQSMRWRARWIAAAVGGASSVSCGEVTNIDQLHSEHPDAGLGARGTDAGDSTVPDARAAGPCYARFGDAKRQVPTGLATDQDGNVIVAGWFEGRLDFGDTVLDAGSDASVFVARFDAECRVLWGRAFPSAPTELSVAASRDQVVAIGSLVTTPLDFGGGPLSSRGGSDFFVVSLSSATGAHRWSRGFGGPGQEFAQGVAIDGVGNVIVTGSFESSIDFGDGPLTSAGGLDVFVAKLDADGHHVYSRSFGDTTEQRSQAVAVDGAGSVVITGFMSGSVDFGGVPLATTGTFPWVFTAKFDATGKYVWSKAFGEGQGRGVAVDASGNVIVTGAFVRGDFGAGPVQSDASGQFFYPQSDAFFAKFTSSGDYIRAELFGDARAQSGVTVAAAPSGDLVVTGIGLGLGFDTGDAGSTAEYDWWVATLDGAGARTWDQGLALGSVGVNGSPPLVAPGSSGVILTNGLIGTIDLGRGALTSAGEEDVLLVRLQR